METKAALYREALRQVNIRRQQAEEAAAENQARLRRAAPEYETARLALLNAQIEQARLAAQALPLQAAQAKIQQWESRLQDILAQAGFTADQLQPQYRCAVCRDTGRVGGGRCRCVEQEMRRLRREQINREFPLELSSFERFQLERYSTAADPQLGTSPRAIMSQVLAYCRAYAEHFRPGAPSLLLMGDAGLGKTHLALSIANRVLDAGFDVVYVSAQQAFAVLDSASRDGSREAWLDAMLEADLLILDDLGTEYVVPHTISVLYQIVNTRLCSKRPTVYTTNIVTQQLMNARYTEKVTSRLLGSCELLQFYGEDVRLQGK